MGSSVRQTPDTFLLDLIKDLQSRIDDLEANSLTQADAIMESLQVGEPVNSPSGFGAASFAGDLIAEGNFNLGSPTTPATVAGDGAISGDLSVEGTITGTGLVTGGDGHDHDGGDGAVIPEAGLATAVSAQLVTGGDNHDHSGGDGGTIPTGGIANDAIDDTKAGDRVPQFYRRQGGSSSDWYTGGNTTYTPGAVRMQGGAKSCSIGSNTVTFPTSFGGTPLVLISPSGRTPDYEIFITSVTSSAFYITSDISTKVTWLAIGPE